MSSVTGKTLPMKKSATIFAILAVLFLALPLGAQEATLGLSSPTTAPGQPMEIVLTVRDARSAEVPETINVPGLRIQLFGRSTRFEMNNFQITSSLTYTYSVVPERTGEFDIPPVSVQVGGKTIQTNPVRLTVVDSAIAAPSAQPAPMPSTANPSVPPTPQGQAIPFSASSFFRRKKPGSASRFPSSCATIFSDRSAAKSATART
ncbi:MAG: BatD family protein [Spartobacteria bacterium]